MYSVLKMLCIIYIFIYMHFSAMAYIYVVIWSTKRAEFYQGLNTAHTCTCIRIYFEWNNPVYM